jgi:hypothetical protein
VALADPLAARQEDPKTRDLLLAIKASRATHGASGDISPPAEFREQPHRTTLHLEETMYEMYPEWGPSRPAENAQAQQAVQAALDLRDNGGERPDDN